MANIHVENDRGGTRVAVTRTDPGSLREDYIAACDGCDPSTPATALENAVDHLDVDH